MATVDELITKFRIVFEGGQNAKDFERKLGGAVDSAVKFGRQMEVAAKRTQAASKSMSSAFRGGFLGGVVGGAVGAAAFSAITRLADAIASIPQKVVAAGAQLQVMETRLRGVEGSAAAGERAFKWLNDFAPRTQLTLEQATEAWTDLRKFGIDPTNGSLQSLVDYSAKTGGSAQQMSSVIRAVGQAFGKTQLRAEEMNQLLDAGIPAWNLLAKATGKNVPELMKLAQAGKLGRKELGLLIAQMGKESAGAAVTASRQFSGLRKNIALTLDGIAGDVARAGIFDLVQNGLRRVLSLLQQARKSGAFEQFARAGVTAFDRLSLFLQGTFIPDFIEPLDNWLKNSPLFKGNNSIAAFFTKDVERAKEVWAEFERQWDSAVVKWQNFWKTDILDAFLHKLGDVGQAVRSILGLAGIGSGGGGTGPMISEGTREERFRRNVDPRANPPLGSGIGPQAGGAAARDPVATSNLMRVAQEELRRQGVPDENLRAAAAHLVGQATMESGLDPNAVHDQGTGYGLYGARLGRRTKMMRWLTANGYSANSAEGQMRYMAMEAMTGGDYGPTRRVLMNASEKTFHDDTNVITRNFERPLRVNYRTGAVLGAYRAGPAGPAGAAVGPYDAMKGSRTWMTPDLQNASRERLMRSMPVIGPQAFSGGGGRSFADNSNTSVVVKVKTNANPDEIASAVNRTLKSRGGRDVAKSLYLRAQEPQSA